MRVLRPDTQTEALRLLAAGDDDCRAIAGGTAVMLMLRHGLMYPSQLVSLDRVADMDYIDITADDIRFGALTTLRTLERSPDLRGALSTLSASLGLVANHRVRQRATIGGNLSESDYASDPPAVLTTLGCTVRIASTSGERIVPLPEFLIDFYETALQHGELVTEVIVPRPSPTARTTYLKYISRSAEDRPCVGVAVYLDVDESGRCSDLRVAVAGSTATPFSLPEVTADFRGQKADSRAWTEISAEFRDAISPIEDGRGSAAYRKQVTENLVRRALQKVARNHENGATRL